MLVVVVILVVVLVVALVVVVALVPVLGSLFICPSSDLYLYFCSSVSSSFSHLVLVVSSLF